MVCGGISLQAHTGLVVIIRESIMADRNIKEILEPHVVPFTPFIGEQFIFMHDNARDLTFQELSENFLAK